MIVLRMILVVTRKGRGVYEQHDHNLHMFVVFFVI